MCSLQIENNACNEEENSYESENDQSFTYEEDFPLNDTKYIDINTDCISQVTNSNVGKYKSGWCVYFTSNKKYFSFINLPTKSKIHLCINQIYNPV